MFLAVSSTDVLKGFRHRSFSQGHAAFLERLAELGRAFTLLVLKDAQQIPLNTMI